MTPLNLPTPAEDYAANAGAYSALKNAIMHCAKAGCEKAALKVEDYVSWTLQHSEEMDIVLYEVCEPRKLWAIRCFSGLPESEYPDQPPTVWVDNAPPDLYGVIMRAFFRFYAEVEVDRLRAEGEIDPALLDRFEQEYLQEA